jgi:dihydrofolate reductase
MTPPALPIMPPEASNRAAARVGEPGTPQITLVAAMAHDRIIGRDNGLPWHLPADLANFKRLTLDKPIIMGRRTWESLPGLLPRRRHLVVTSDPGYSAAGCELAPSPDAALRLVADAPEVMIVGGASLYAALLSRATHMALTFIDAQVPGDVRFPSWDPRQWQEQDRVHREADAANRYALDFVRLVRRTERS